MRTPGELLQARLINDQQTHSLGEIILEMFKKGLLTRMWIDPITNEVFAS